VAIGGLEQVSQRGHCLIRGNGDYCARVATVVQPATT
jgi:hypothetical protein